MKNSSKTVSNACLFLYVGVYLWSWKLFLDFEAFSFLKPYAVIFILSAFICLILAKAKKQMPFFSFFVGSIFGPVGVLMLILSTLDFRSVNLADRDAVFYAKFQNEIEKLRNRILKHKRNESSFSFLVFGQRYRVFLYHKLQFMAEVVNLQLNFPFNVYWATYDEFLALLQNIENALKKEQARNSTR